MKEKFIEEEIKMPPGFYQQSGKQFILSCDKRPLFTSQVDKS